MKCQKCGHSNPEGLISCEKCKTTLTMEKLNDRMQVVSTPKNPHFLATICLIIAGIISGWVIIAAGAAMSGIQSQAGNTVTETYYHAMGQGFIGLGIFAGSLLIALGIYIGRK